MFSSLFKAILKPFWGYERSLLSFAKKIWKGLLIISLLLLCIPFFKLIPNFTNIIVVIYKSSFFKIAFIAFLLWTSFYVFRYSFLTSMIAGVYISNLGFKPTKAEEQKFNNTFKEFTSKYKFDILNISHIKKPWTLWKLFFWLPKTIEEMAREKILDDLADTCVMNYILREAQKEEELKEQVSKKAEELKTKYNINEKEVLDAIAEKSQEIKSKVIL